MTHHLPSSGRPARDAGGYSILEILIASILALAIIGFGFQIWEGSTRWYEKGEDVQDSLHEAALLLAHLRQDLTASCPGPRGASDVTFATAIGGAPRGWMVLLDPGQHSVEAGDVELPAVDAGRSRLTFFVRPRGSDEPRSVTWSYDRARSIVERESEGRTRSLGRSRLKSFSIELFGLPRSGTEDAQALFGPIPEARVSLSRLWYRVQVEVQGESETGKIEPTRLSLETRIFPKHLNRQLQSLWRPGPRRGSR